MYFLNLSLLQFVAVFGSISALAVALYLLDRSHRRQIVSTLRFWVAAEQPAPAARRRRISQPWSLVLQLAGMALLLLAIADLRFGSADSATRNHVLVLDTSAWMAARSGDRTLMDLARERALRYVRALPAGDRVMLVRADGLSTPATAFEPDHRVVEAAIDASQPGYTALNIDEALAFARHVQPEGQGRPGEIAFVGAARTVELDPSAPPLPRNLRVLLAPDAIENAGLRKVGVRRSVASPDVWEIYVSVHNYGSRPRNVTLNLDFGPPGNAGRFAGGSRRLTLAPGSDQETTFDYKTAAAGVIGVTLLPHDAFPADDHAELELPSQSVLPVTVYSSEPDLLRPVLSATPRVAAVYRKPEEYRPGDRGLVILDRFSPPARPTADSLWIAPPETGSPIPIRTVVEQVPFQGWDAGLPETAGLRTKDFKLDKTLVFQPSNGDERIGEVDAGPVIVARAGSPKIVVFGFHPGLSAMRYELATPLLFANLLRWFAPEIFRRWEISAGSIGNIKLITDENTPENEVKVTGADGAPLPFTLHDRTLNFFSGAPGTVHVDAGDHEYLYSLTIPQLWDTRWEPPATALKGMPRFKISAATTVDPWPWLALAGALCLIAEWILYGRFRRGGLRRTLDFRARRRSASEVRP
jgi:von Willebrand factor type A domain/Aerotolerance regulator N-terminal